MDASPAFASGIATRAGVLDGQAIAPRTTGGRTVVVERNEESRGESTDVQPVTVGLSLFPYSVEVWGWVLDHGSGRSLSVTHTGIAHYYEHYRVWAAPILVAGSDGERGMDGVLDPGSYGWLFSGAFGPTYVEEWEAAYRDWAAANDVPPDLTLPVPVGQDRFKSAPGPMELPDGRRWGTEPSVEVRVREQLGRVLEEESG